MDSNSPRSRSRKPVLMALAVLALAVHWGCDSAPTSQAQAVATGANSSASDPADSAPTGRATNYNARLKEHRLKASQGQEVEVVVRPGRGLKINEDFPWQFRFGAVEGLGLAETTVASDAIGLEEMEATIPLPLGELKPGTYTIEATGNFSVCNDERCDILRNERLDFEVEVTGQD